MQQRIIDALKAYPAEKLTAPAVIHVAMSAIEAFARDSQHAAMTGEQKRDMVPALVEVVLQNALHLGMITLTERIELGEKLVGPNAGVLNDIVELVMAASKHPELVQMATEIAEQVKGLCASKCKPARKRPRKP